MIEQVPAVTTFIAPFTTVQTVGVVEVKVTGYEMPALLVATNGCGVLTVVIAVGGVNVMVWRLPNKVGGVIAADATEALPVPMALTAATLKK